MEQHTTNEKAGSNHWKDKLGDAEDLSSFLLADKNATWEKLQGRLHTPVRKRAGWYWLAAACVLGVISGAFLLLQNRQTVTVVKNQVKVKASIDSIAVVQPTTTLPVKVSNDQKAAIIAVTKAPAKKQLKKILVEPTQSLTVKTDDSIVVTASTIQPINSIATPPLTSTNIPEKKKLKVVHVNELGTPLPELRSRMANDDYSVIQFNILNQQFFNTVPVIPPSKVTSSSKHKNIPN